MTEDTLTIEIEMELYEFLKHLTKQSVWDYQVATLRAKKLDSRSAKIELKLTRKSL